MGRAQRERRARLAFGRTQPVDRQPGLPSRIPPARRGRGDRPVELPGVHPDGLDRLRAGRRQRGGVQAQRVHPGVGIWLAERSPRWCPSSRSCRWSPAAARPARRCAAAGVDKIAFTGSTATGKRVMAACARDADAGADGVRRQGRDDRRRRRRPRAPRPTRRCGAACPTPARPASASSGSTSTTESTTRSSPNCSTAQADLRAGDGPAAKIGPITMPKQLDVIRRHIDDALAARRPGGAGRARRRRRPFVQPTILVDVPRGPRGGHRGDLRADLTVTRVARHGRGGRAGQRHRLRPRRHRVRPGATATRSPTASRRA